MAYVVIDDGVKIGKSSVIDSGYFGADFYQFCRVGSLPHRFLLYFSFTSLSIGLGLLFQPLQSSMNAFSLYLYNF